MKNFKYIIKDIFAKEVIYKKSIDSIIISENQF